MKKADLTGMVFGRLTVLREGEKVGAKIGWVCQCTCGKTKTVAGNNLKSKKTESCGCLFADVMKVVKTKHGQARTPLYAIWSNMKRRCNSENHIHFSDYGGRGIYVCERWLASFSAFAADMGPRPSKNHSIDRINNEGPYSPENCRWATKSEQKSNSRPQKFKPRGVKLELDGESLTMRQWSVKLGIPLPTLQNRKKLGLPAREILSTAKFASNQWTRERRLRHAES